MPIHTRYMPVMMVVVHGGVAHGVGLSPVYVMIILMFSNNHDINFASIFLGSDIVLHGDDDDVGDNIADDCMMMHGT